MTNYTILRRQTHETHGEVWSVAAEHVEAEDPQEALDRAAKERELHASSYLVIDESEATRLKLSARSVYEVLPE